MCNDKNDISKNILSCVLESMSGLLKDLSVKDYDFFINMLYLVVPHWWTSTLCTVYANLFINTNILTFTNRRDIF